MRVDRDPFGNMMRKVIVEVYWGWPPEDPLKSAPAGRGERGSLRPPGIISKDMIQVVFPQLSPVEVDSIHELTGRYASEEQARGILDRIAELVGTEYGVAQLFPSWKPSSPEDAPPIAHYVDLGDPDLSTVIFDIEHLRFRLMPSARFLNIAKKREAPRR